MNLRHSHRGPEHLWTFLRVCGIEPTNNAAERALRHAVLRRNSSGGTASEWGSRFVERLLSVAATCRQQGRNVLEYLTRVFPGSRYGWSTSLTAGIQSWDRSALIRPL
jgi:transposase